MYEKTIKRSLSLLLAVAIIFSSMYVGLGEVDFGGIFAVKAKAADEVPEGYIGVYTVDDLYNVRNDLTANYILMNDIDLADELAEGGQYYNEGYGWSPIGGGSSYTNGEFTGVFDGNNHVIYGLSINNPAPISDTPMYIGLFANNAGTIKNLFLEDVYFYAKNSGFYHLYVGSIAAYNTGTIEGCGVEGSFPAIIRTDGNIYSTGGYLYGPNGNLYIGGVCGSSFGEIRSCYNRIQLGSSDEGVGYNRPGVGAEYYFGGICGYSEGNVSECANIGFINNSEMSNVGATVGHDTGTAGICGFADGSISNCLNWGSAQVGISNGGTITNSYAFVPGEYTGSYLFGGSTKNTGCYYSTGYRTDSSCSATSLTPVDMTIEENFEAFDFENIWFISENPECHLPQLRSMSCRFIGHNYEWDFDKEPTCTTEGEKSLKCIACGSVKVTEIVPVTHSYGEWNVIVEVTSSSTGEKNRTCSLCGNIETVIDPVIPYGYTPIYTAKQLASIQCGTSKNYILMNDIDLSVDYSSGWTPIGCMTNPAKAFIGTFDGNGYTISNMYVAGELYSGVYPPENVEIKGLFSVVNGVIKNVVLENAYINGLEGCESAGLICGKLEGGEISNCVVSGKITDVYDSTGVDSGTGGLVGFCNGESLISKCAVYCDVQGSAIIGYIYYLNSDDVTIENCYNGSVITEGFCRSSSSTSAKPTIRTSYSIALAGDSTTFNRDKGQIINDGVYTTLDRDELRYQDTFEGFDFENTWYIAENSIYPYPQLKSHAFINKCQHTYGEWVVDTEATCETDGSKHRTCTACGEVETEAITATGHIVSEWVVTTEPTCSTEGEKTGYCGSCGKACETEAVATLEHNYNYDSFEYAQNPDNEDEYLKQHKCNDCDATTFGEEVYIPIRTVDDLYNVRNDLTTNYLLLNDIDLTEATSIDGDYDFMDNGWNPIGSGNVYGANAFSGIFDGNGYKITGMRIDVTTLPSGANSGVLYLGLFANVTGTVKNLSVLGSIKSLTYVFDIGGIAGRVSSGTIINCSSDCEVNARTNCRIGGIVGSLSGGTVSQCYNTADLSGDYIGGIVGILSMNYVAYITNCYNTGALSGRWCCGIIGYSVSGYDATDESYVEDCYNLGSLSGSEANESVLFTYDSYFPTVTTCYYLEGLGDSQTGATALNDAMMQKQSAYTGFDFDTIWFMDDSNGYPYPQLINNPHRETTCQHTYSDWVIDTEATCESDGSKHRTCTACGEVETDVITSTGHNYSTEWTIDVAATCTTSGSKSHHCLNCDATTDVTEILATGHIVGEWVVTTEPTCSTEGEKTGYCGSCGEACETEAVATLEHNYDENNYEYVQNPENPDEYHKQYECEDCGSTKLDENPAIIKSLIIESLPDNTTYIEGQEIDTTGLVIKAEFDDGATEYVTDYEISYDNSVAGEQEVTISYGNATATFTVTFTQKTLVSIAITKMPDKTTYVSGESFDNTGMVVTATYDNGLTEEVTGYTVSTLPKTTGTKNLIVTYSGKRLIIQVTVIEKVAVTMEVVEPENIDQIIGDDFDTTGMVVTVTYNDGTSAEVTDYTIEGFGDFVGVGYVYVTYGELSYELIIIAHSPEEAWVIESQSTCTTDGLKHLYCTECGEIIKTEAILATGHNYSAEYTIDVEATCTAEGSKSRHCSICDSQTDVTAIAIIPHSYGDYVYDYSANTQTCECAVCGHTLTEEIPTEGLFTFVLSDDGTYYILADCSEAASGAIEIPLTYKGLHVTAVGDSAFENCSGITEIVIPEGICSIGTCAFKNCVKLEKVYWNAINVEKVSNIFLYAGSEGSGIDLIFGDSVENIPEKLCSSVDVVGSNVLPTSVKNYIKSVTFGKNVKTIGDSAFYKCDGIETVELPDSVISIGEEAFYECTALVSVTLNSGIESIGEQAFTSCSELESIEIPYGVTRIERETFSSCVNLKTVTLPDGVTFIGEGAFNECSSLESIEIPDSVTTIDACAFVGAAFTSIEIPDSVTSIASAAFGMCKKLKFVKLPENITHLESQLFYGCSSLESVVISDKITNIGEECFVDCVDFKYIFYAGSEIQWEEIEVSDTSEYLDNAIIHYNSSDHTYEWSVTKEATCTEYGTKVEKCVYCDLQKGTEVISATGHTYSEWVVDAQATCETDGSRHRACATCQATETDVISATGHKYSTEWTIVTPATCENVGEKYCECIACDSKITEEIAALGHDYADEFTIDVEATCQAEGSKSRHCSRCDSKIDITVIGISTHNYGDWVITTPATCEADGERTKSCIYCGDAITETISAYGHVYSVLWTTDKTPTCTVAGSKSHHCNRPGCDSKIDVTEIEPLGHSFGEWQIIENPSCTVNGQKYRMCNTCYSEELAVITAPGHTYGEWIIDSAADCENDGARHAVCGTCSYVNNETVKAYGHDYESVFTVDKEATCTEAGSKSHHCSRCDSIADETVVLALGHHISTMWTIDTEPTCESEGSKSHHCLRCDIKEDVTVIPVASHIYGKWEVVTPATMDTAGVRAHKCYNCEMTEEAELPKLLKYTATFVADGDVVATVDFPEDATGIEIPEVPHKDKFNGEWENFNVRNKNFTVNAVYTPIPTEQIDGITAGNTADYYSSTGEVEINLNVSAPGKTIVTTTTKAVPLDIIFVLDQSGSMADGNKKDALKNAVGSFSNEILSDAIANSVDHRIAVVGFASGSNNNLNYQNTELLTADVVKYNRITNADYQNALVSVNDNGELNEVIADAVNEIDAEGATKADLGLEMASSIFANNPVTDNRQRVVVFLTDGVPTSYSNFEYSVANAAIQNAYQLKDTYDATVYSVGVFDDETSENNSVNNFMNYVSSNYNEEKVMEKKSTETSENTNGYYLNVNDASTLSDVFTSIVEETTTHTGRFTNATLKYTLTKYFTLTSVQEEAIRSNAIQTLGVANEQIAITRNADGTTAIVISVVEPWAEGEAFVIDFTFRATANGNTLKSGTYQVGTFESGVILENGEGYEAVFAPNSVDIGGTSGIAVFNINSVPYAINRLSSTTNVVAPATSFGADYNFIGWNVPANLTLNNEVKVFDAALLKNEYKISWNIDGEISEEIYAVGDFITVPQVGNNSIGGAFVGWDKTIPETMPSENLTITAIYDAHYHKYDVTKNFELCIEGGTLTYTCECGDTYTEDIAPYEHTWEAITGATSENDKHNVGFRCTVCGAQDDKDLELERKDKKENADNSHNTATYEFDYVDENGDKHQPDGDVEISVQLDDVFEGDIPEDANASVYRVNDDGSRTKLPCEQNGMNMTFTTDHFSTYEFEFTTGEQKYLFAQIGTEIDYDNQIIFSDTYGANEFKSLVTYLSPATLKSNPNNYGYFGTGTSVDLANGDMTDSFKVIINGDLNGDGVCDVLDASYAALVSSGKKTATQDEIYAANGEIAEEIDVLDYQSVVNRAVS